MPQCEQNINKTPPAFASSPPAVSSVSGASQEHLTSHYLEEHYALFHGTQQKEEKLFVACKCSFTEVTLTLKMRKLHV